MKTAALFSLVTGLFLALAAPAWSQSKIVDQIKKGIGRGKTEPTTRAQPGGGGTATTPDTPPPLPPDAAPDAALFLIEINGNKEQFVIKLLPEIAPKTAENFRKNIESGFYEGQAFHRVIRNYLVQGGDPLSKDEAQKELWGTSDNGQSIPGEFSGKHKRWAVGMAHKPGEATSSGSQFYICLRDTGNLDGQYAVFGEVIQGVEALNRISGVMVDTNDVPVKRIPILSTKMIRSDSKLALGGPKGGIKKTKPDSQKGGIEKFIERVW